MTTDPRHGENTRISTLMSWRHARMGCFSRGKPGGDKAIPARCLVLFIPLINQEEKAFSSLGLERRYWGRGGRV